MKPLYAPRQSIDPIVLIGLIFSIIGIFGWLSMVVFFLMFPYSEGPDVEDVGRFFRNVIVLMGGGVFSGLFSIAGMIMCAIGIARQRDTMLAYIGLGMGLGGIVAAVLMMFWRLNVVLG